MIELIPLRRAYLRVGERLDAGGGPNGHGVIAEIESAQFTGRIAKAGRARQATRSTTSSLRCQGRSRGAVLSR